MDYYFVLVTSQESERTHSLQVIEQFGMSRFAEGGYVDYANGFRIE